MKPCFGSNEERQNSGRRGRKTKLSVQLGRGRGRGRGRIRGRGRERVNHDENMNRWNYGKKAHLFSQPHSIKHM